MKKSFEIIAVFILVFAFSWQSDFACTVHIEPLRKDFRNAKKVFLGEIISTEKIDKNELSDELKGFEYLEKVTFSVDKSWKGHDKKVTIYASPSCECPKREYKLFKGRKLLVFTDKNLVFDSCNLSSFENTQNINQNAEEIIKQLDKFSFRLWARIYPF